MDRGRWVRVQELFLAALEQPPEMRAEFVEQAGDDPSIRAAVERLLEADADPATVLAGSAEALLTAFPGAEPRSGLSSSPDSGSEAGLAEGTRIGPYRLLERIGEGGMGKVYLAEHAEFEHRVAVKLIKRGMDTDEIVRRFAGERLILARLEHPNIGRLLDGGVTDDGLPWFSMEYVDGEPIDEYCTGRNLPLRDRLALFELACEAVQYAHANLVVHRDLKPSNILVTADGTVKLLDFGIAKVIGGDESEPVPAMTRTGLRPMTPGYAAPEQLLGLPVTTATDVYALGVVLYRLLAGRGPYGEDLNTAELEAAILKTSPSPPRMLPSAIRSDRDVDNIALMALRKEPERRYDSAGALAEDVRRYLAGRTVHATSDSLGYRARKFVRRNRAAVTGVAAALIAIAATVSVYTVRLREERDHAALEARKFQAVATYFEEVILESTPDDAGAREVTVTDLLEKASVHAEEVLGEFPDALSKVIGDLGFAFRSRDEYERAEPLMRRALALKRELIGDGVDDEIVQYTSSTATLLAAMGRYDEAEGLFQEAERLSRRYPEFNGYAVAFATNNLAKHYTRMGRYAEAEPYLAEAVDVYTELLGGEHLYTAIAIGNHARALFALGELSRPDSLLTLSIAYKKVVAPDGDLAIPEDMYTLSDLKRLRMEPDAALELADSALGQRQAIPHEDRSDVALSMQQRGLLLVDRGDVDAGLAALRQGDSLFRVEAEPEHPLTYEGSVRLGTGLRIARQWEEAEAHLLQGVEETDAWLPAGHPGRAGPRFELGMLYMDQARWVEAERWLRDALAIREAGLPAGHWSTARTKGVLGASLLRNGTPAEAKDLLEQAQAVLRETLGASHPYTVEIAAGLRSMR